MHAASLVLASVVTAVKEARSFLSSLSTPEARLAATAVLVAATVLLVGFVVPRLLRRVGGRVVRWLADSRLTSRAGDRGVVPTTVDGLVVRTVQLGVVAAAVVGLLSVWGLLDDAEAELAVLGLTTADLARIAATLLLIVLAFASSDIIRDAVRKFSRGTDRITAHQEEVLLRVGQLGVLVVLVTGGLTVWGVDLSGLLVGAGFLGIVVGLAARQTLGSLFAGLVLMVSRPFTIGDWVAIGDDEGAVTEITVFNTRLRTPDGEMVVFPNDAVSNSPVTNRSREGILRLRREVGVDYEADPDHAREVAVEAMEAVDAVLDEPGPRAVPTAFGDSAVVLELRFWIDRPTPARKWEATAAVVAGVRDAFAAEEIRIPFPQRELTTRPEAEDFRIGEAGPPAAGGGPDGAGADCEREDGAVEADGNRGRSDGE